MGAIWCIDKWPRGEGLAAPDDPTMSKGNVGANTGVCTRDDVKQAEAKTSALDNPTRHRSMRRSNDVSSELKMLSAPNDPMTIG